MSAIRRKFRRAIRDFNMIEDGDKIAVAVSGGCDSLTLLTLLWEEKRAIGREYDLLAIHILGDGSGPREHPHEPLARWLEEFKARTGVDYVLASFRLPENEPLPMNCFRCSWNRRKSIFLTAHERGCNRVAFGHHLDDNVETALLNLFCKGRLEMMKISSPLFGGVLHIIRPLVYVSKGEIRGFARNRGFPEPPPPCPMAEHSTRKLMGDMIRSAEMAGFKGTKRNIFNAALRCSRLTEVKDER
jgi:tRNA 2-thiocytidine biosynthesis protein TtcA